MTQRPSSALYLYLEVIATESPIAPNDSLCAPNQRTKSLPKSTRRKNGKFTKTSGTNLHYFKMAACFYFLELKQTVTESLSPQ